jgi:hypothetical protein
MTRIKQFANDMGLTYNEAKGLVAKGRKKKDGGSTVLEKFMPIEIVPKRKTDRSRAKEKMKDRMNPKKRQKEQEELAKQPVKAKNGKVTRINKDKTMQAKSGQFKNIVRDSVSGKITPEEAQKKIRKLVIAKQSGGGFDDDFKALQALNREIEKAKAKPTAQKIKEQLQKDIKDAPDKSTKSFLTRELKAGGKKAINLNLLPTEFQTEKEKKKFLGGDKPKKKATKDNIARVGAGTSKMRKSMPRGDITKKMNKGGALKDLPSASENPGLRKLPTEVRNKMGYKKKGGTMKMMGGGTYNMMPRKMSKGGVARGTGAAVKGTGFKGVY